MKQETLSEKVYNVGNEVGIFAFKLHSTHELLNIILEDAQEEALLDESPLNGLRGIQLLFDSICEEFKCFEVQAEDMLKTQHDVKEVISQQITVDVLKAMAAEGYTPPKHKISVTVLNDYQYSVNLDGKPFRTWDIYNKAFSQNKVAPERI